MYVHIDIMILIYTQYPFDVERGVIMGTAKKIAFINGKGGCGKTTSIFHVAGVYAQQKQKVLVIDLDYQQNTTDVLLMNTETRSNKTIYDFFLGNATPSEITSKSLFQSRGNAKAKYYGVDCMSADINLQNGHLLRNVDGAQIKSQLDNFVESRGYHVVLIDMPPSSYEINNIVFQYIADCAVIPMSSDVFSVVGYGKIMEVMNHARNINPNFQIIGVFLARYMANCIVDQYIREQMLEFDTFIDIQIPLASDLRESIMFGRPISFYKNHSKSKEAFEKLVSAIELKLSMF